MLTSNRYQTHSFIYSLPLSAVSIWIVCVCVCDMSLQRIIHVTNIAKTCPVGTDTNYNNLLCNGEKTIFRLSRALTCFESWTFVCVYFIFSGFILIEVEIGPIFHLQKIITNDIDQKLNVMPQHMPRMLTKISSWFCRFLARTHSQTHPHSMPVSFCLSPLLLCIRRTKKKLFTII